MQDIRRIGNPSLILLRALRTRPFVVEGSCCYCFVSALSCPNIALSIQHAFTQCSRYFILGVVSILPALLLDRVLGPSRWVGDGKQVWSIEKTHFSNANADLEPQGHIQ